MCTFYTFCLILNWLLNLPFKTLTVPTQRTVIAAHVLRKTRHLFHLSRDINDDSGDLNDDSRDVNDDSRDLKDDSGDL